ncbi:MAG: hypothetical protein ABEI96_10800 [Haloarculaceae archaeon]
MVRLFDDRGQAYTLEGLIASVLLLSALLYGLQAVDVAPWAGGTNDEQAESLRTQADDVLAMASDDDALRTAVSCVGSDGNPAANVGHRGTDAGTELGTLLGHAFAANGHNYNVYFQFHEPTGGRERLLVYPVLKTNPATATLPQEPDADAAAATRAVALSDGTPLLTTDDEGKCTTRVGTFGHPDSATLSGVGSSNDLYVPDENDAGTEFYNVVEVRVVVW